MGMMLGATVYVFSIILAVFLIGLAIGSASVPSLLREVHAAPRAWLVPDSSRHRHRLDRLHDRRLASLLADQPALTTSPWHTFQLDLVRCLVGYPSAHYSLGREFSRSLLAAAAPPG